MSGFVAAEGIVATIWAIGLTQQVPVLLPDTDLPSDQALYQANRVLPVVSIDRTGVMHKTRQMTGLIGGCYAYMARARRESAFQ